MARKCVSVPLGVCTRAQSPSRKNRGSALLLTVGLLAILAMLGSTFLLISRMNRKQCVAIASKIPVDPLAAGIVSQIKEELKRDLYLSDTAGEGPYNAAKMIADGATDQQKWQRFIDYPMKCSSPTVMARDYWLADGSTSGGHLSNLYGTCTDTYTTADADTDADGNDDAKSENSNIGNEIGGTYHVAVRVVDTSGLLNCNTACNATTLTTPVCPVNVELTSFLGATIYSSVSSARNSNDIALYNGNCALCLLDPGASYKPFAIGDEMYLRWLKGGAQSETGRLFDATKTGETALAAATRKHMTTFSCTRSFVRYPDTVLQVRLAVDKKAVSTDGRGLGNAALRQALYEKLKVIMGDDKKAAHVVANAWAYADGMDQAKEYAFAPTAGFTVYGVKPQLVITEAFAKHEKNTLVDPQNDGAYGYAIEIYNPTDAAISLTNYKIVHPDGTASPSLSGNIAKGAKKVFYDFGKGTQSTDTADTFFGVSVASWTSCTSVDFSGGGDRKVRLIRGTNEIPIDEVSNSSTELDYSCANKNSVTESDEVKDIRRDDDPARARSNVAMYKSFTSHVLGNVNSTTFTTAECCEGFKINEPETSGLANLGELLNVYMAGPIKEGTTPAALPQQLKTNYATSAFLGRLNYATGSPVSASVNYPNTIACGTLLGELFEAVPVDSIRDPAPAAASRTYGKININTAPKEVLQQLPFAMVDHEGTAVTLDDAAVTQIAQKIIDYRTTSNGFMTPGEVVIPLADHAATLLSVSEKQAGYLEASNSLYSSISNLISVNSDTFVANIKITMKGAGADMSWNYVLFIDRSNCWDIDDDPAVLLFSPAK